MASREKTVSEHKERIYRVLLYIGENIDGDLSLETISKIACFSPFHFHRLFTAYVGETVCEYVRRIRLERAANRFVHSGEPVTSVALDSGYETPGAFTRAFREHFGQNPTEFKGMKNQKQSGAKLPDMKEEAKPMEPEIRTMPEQKVLFVRKTGSYDKAAAEAWSALMGFAYSRKLMNKNTKLIGISLDNPDITPEVKIRYDACITVDKDVKPEGEIGVQTISGGRHAVFLHKGPYDRLGETYNSIFAGWLPSSGERLRDTPCFEIYLNRDPRRTKPENLRTEIFVPIE